MGPTLLTTAIFVCEFVVEAMYEMMVGTHAPMTTSTRMTMVLMMKLRWVTRFLYSRPIIRPMLRGVFCLAAPPELTATLLCSCF